MENNISCQIQYNKAMEFVGSILKYSNNQKRQVDWNTPELERDISKGIMNFSPNEQVQNWLKDVDNRISPFLQNDIEFVTNETYKLLDVCLNLILMENIESPLELIEALKSLDLSTMIEISYKYYDLHISLEDDEGLRAALAENFSDAVASSFLHFKNNPREYMNKLIDVCFNFYTQFYQPYEENIYKYMEKRITFNKELFEEDNIYFINTIGIGDYSKAIDNHDSIIMYMSYFIDVGIFYFTFENTLVMCYGQTIEHRFETRKKQNTYKALFKALSDEKRFEILKMTSKRPWYNKELADYFNLTTATLSYHLNLLLDLEILNFEPSIINNRYYYTTNKENLKTLFDLALNDLLD